MGTRDSITEQNLRHVLASVEAAAIAPPDDLLGAAREMFLVIAEGNRARSWTSAHALALADYCRVTLLWQAHLKLIEDDGALKGATLSPHFKALRALGVERIRIAKLLGIGHQRDRLLGGNDQTNVRAREIGAALRESRDDDPLGLLA